MEIITRKRTVWLTFLDVLYKKKLPQGVKLMLIVR